MRVRKWSGGKASGDDLTNGDDQQNDLRNFYSEQKPNQSKFASLSIKYSDMEILTYTNTQSLDRDNSEGCQQCCDDTDNKCSWNHSKTNSLDQMMTEGSAFCKISK